MVLAARGTPPIIAERWSVSQEETAQATDVTVRGAPGPGYALRVTAVYIHINGLVTVTLEEGTSVFKFRFYGQAAGDGVALGETLITLAENTALTVTTSAAISVSLTVSGYTERLRGGEV